MVNKFHKISDSGNVIGYYRNPVIEDVVDRHNGNIALNQFNNLRITKINTGKHHTVKASVPAVLQICHSVLSVLIAVYKGNVITTLFRRPLEAVKHSGKVVMRQSACGFVYKEHPDAMGSVRLQRPR